MATTLQLTPFDKSDFYSSQRSSNNHIFNMKYLVISALLATGAHALDLWDNYIEGHPTFKIGSEIVLDYTAPTPPPSATFTITLRAENSTPYDYIPGPFGSTIGLYDLRDKVIKDAVPFTNGSFTWKVEPTDEEGLFYGPDIWYFIRADWSITGTPYSSGDSVGLFYIED